MMTGLLSFPVLLSAVFMLYALPIAAQTNITIDDTYGDGATGARPTYFPLTGSWNDAGCSGCAVQPDPGLALDGTWTAATYHQSNPEVSIQLSFEGTAVYVFFILPNLIRDGVTTVTECNFTLDGSLVGDFLHLPTTSTEILYNQLVFNSTDLDYRNHTLKISISDQDHDIFINFDYAQYTVPSDSSTPSSSTSSSNTPSSSAPVPTPTDSTPNIGAIAGGIVGGVFGLALICGFLVFLRRRRRGAPQSIMSTGENRVQLEPEPFTSHTPPTSSSEPHSNHNAMWKHPKPAFPGQGNASGRSPASSGPSQSQSSTTRDDDLRRQVQVMNERVSMLQRLFQYSSTDIGGDVPPPSYEAPSRSSGTP